MAGSFPLGPGGINQVVCVGGEVAVVTRGARLVVFREVELSAQVGGGLIRFEWYIFGIYVCI